MRTYVFVFVNAETTNDYRDGFETQPSFSCQARDLTEAVNILAASNPLDSSEDPDDYQNDIDDGNIAVYCPTVYCDHGT